MKSSTGVLTWTRFATVALLVAMAIPSRMVAQEQQQQKNLHHRYKLVELGTFGGPQSYVSIPDDNYAPVLNNQGTVVGWGDTSAPDPYSPFCFNGDCMVSHAFERKGGALTDLSVLPGGASSASLWISSNGLIAGVSENGEIDPLYSALPQIRAVLWQDGKITNLGALPEGGYQSYASAVNSLGQVVGGALNTVPDTDSMQAATFWLWGGIVPPYQYQTRAFLWQNEVMQDLGTLGGPDAVALLVNERGQVVGDSYTSSAPSAYCATNLDFALATGAFIWENGKMKNLGNFGGSCTFAVDLNDRGQVVGASTLAGDLEQHPFLWEQGVLTDLHTLGGSTGDAIAINDAGEITGWSYEQGDQSIHAVLWKNGKLNDLGTVGSDPCSIGFSINSEGQVVGESAPGCDFEGQPRAFVRECNGPMLDLNTLISPDTGLYLTTPGTINDRGEIAGSGVDANGNGHAFLLIPCDENHPDVEGCDYGLIDTATAAQVNPPKVLLSSLKATGSGQAYAGVANRLRRARARQPHGSGSTQPPVK